MLNYTRVIYGWKVTGKKIDKIQEELETVCEEVYHNDLYNIVDGYIIEDTMCGEYFYFGALLGSMDVYDCERGAWNDTNYKLAKKGDFYPDENEENTYHKAEQDMIYTTEEDPNIHMMWDSDKYPYTWWIDTNYTDSAYFDIVDEDDEDGQTWARCCIIDCSNIL